MPNQETFSCSKKTHVNITQNGFSYKEELFNEKGEKVSINPFPNRGKNVKRGKCRKFTSGAKTRMIQKVVNIGYAPDSFLTITFPVTFPNAAYSKVMLNRYLRYYTRRGMSFIWRMEPQKRGAPHFHILCYGEIEGFRDDCQDRWVKTMVDFNKKQKKKSKVKHIKERAVILEPLNDNDTDALKKTFLYVTKYSSKRGDRFLNMDGTVYRPEEYGEVRYDLDANNQRYGFVVGDEVVNIKTGEIDVAEKVLEGRQWGCMGNIRKTETKGVTVEGNPMSLYLYEVHGCDPEYMRKYHVWVADEEEFFMSWFQEYIWKREQDKIFEGE